MMIGYIAIGPRTPDEATQRVALSDAGCEHILVDHLPERRSRKDGLEGNAFRPDDTIVICRSFLIGDGKIDTANTLTKLGEIGAHLVILDGTAVDLKDAASVDFFAEQAVTASRQATAQHMLANRASAGRKSKLSDLTPEQDETARWLVKHPATKYQVAVDYVNGPCGLEGVSRAAMIRRYGNKND